MKNNFKKISEKTVQNKFVKTGSIQKKWKEKNRFYQLNSNPGLDDP